MDVESFPSLRPLPTYTPSGQETAVNSAYAMACFDAAIFHRMRSATQLRLRLNMVREK
jgi:hypothetical protein